MAGGYREGSGRKTGGGKYGEPTVIVRIPLSLVEAVQRMLDDLERYIAKERKKKVKK